jgi:hypothetical protein
MKRSPSHISQVIDRIRAAWWEMDHPQPRRFETQAEVPLDGVQQRRAARRKIKELEARSADELPLAVRWPYLRH